MMNCTKCIVIVKSSIYEFVMSLPNKIFSKVGEDGLNRGQNKIGIAGTLAFNASVLILDDN